MDEGVQIDETDLEPPTPRSLWKCGKEDIPTGQIVFFSQIILVYIVTIACIANLTLGNEPKELWVSLLASCIGYILPAPHLQV